MDDESGEATTACKLPHLYTDNNKIHPIAIPVTVVNKVSRMNTESETLKQGALRFLNVLQLRYRMVAVYTGRNR